MIDPRKFVGFFKTKTGQITAFGLLFFVGGATLSDVVPGRSFNPSWIAAFASSIRPAFW